MDGLLLSDDLIFISRIQGTARDHGLGCGAVRTSEQLIEHASTQMPRCVLLDLHLLDEDLAGVIGQLKSLSPAPYLVGYGSHVDAPLLHRARVAGCDLVLPRSQFVEDLPSQLPSWFRSSEPRA